MVAFLRVWVSSGAGVRSCGSQLDPCSSSHRLGTALAACIWCRTLLEAQQ